MPVDSFKCVEEAPKFNEDFIKIYNEDRYFLEVDVHDPKKIHDLHNDLPFFA